MIPYGRQQITEADIQAVVDVLRSDFITQGPVVPQFERAVADYCGAGYAVAANSATSTLHLACRALDVGPGDLVWTSPITFVASANCAHYCGADVDFVDIDPQTFNLCPEKLAEKLEQVHRNGERVPKVVIPVHLAGQSCDMSAIAELAREYGFRVIEDASHAIGGRYEAAPVGSCRYSDITVFSFHPVKIITTGEGGMATTNDATFAERMERLRSHGITRDPGRMTHSPDGPWYYQQIELGYNYRMTEIQAALGLSQFQRLDDLVSRRRSLAEQYDSAFGGTTVRGQLREEKIKSAHHLYVVRVPATDHLATFEKLREEAIGVNLHYIPVYLQPDYKRPGYAKGYCEAAEAYYREAISLPLYPDLTGEQQSHVISVLEKALSKGGADVSHR